MLIEGDKFINGRTRLNPLDLFQFRPQDRSMKATRAGFFTVAVITPWNKLSAVVVMAPSLDSFKARLDDAYGTIFPELP